MREMLSLWSDMPQHIPSTDLYLFDAEHSRVIVISNSFLRDVQSTYATTIRTVRSVSS
jgi:hypothetical protein